jgi:hypothetical protein
MYRSWIGTMDATTLHRHLGDDTEVDIATTKKDGDEVTTIIWSVAAAGASYVRSVRADRGGWYRRAIRTGEGGFVIDGARVAVRFEHVDDDAELDAVDAAYEAKYGRRWRSSTDAVLTPETRACTLRVLPA